MKCIVQAEVKNRGRGDVEVEVRHTQHCVIPALTVIIPKKYPDQSPWVGPLYNTVQYRKHLQYRTHFPALREARAPVTINKA